MTSRTSAVAHDHASISPLGRLALALSLATSVLAAILIVQLVLRERTHRNRTVVQTNAGTQATIGAAGTLHVVASITASGVTVQRTLPTMAFALEPGQSLDSRISPGPFRAEFTVPFSTGVSDEAHIGAEFQGGKLIVRRRGEILLSDFAGEQSRTAMTAQPLRLARTRDELTITFESDGSQSCRVRALWQPSQSLTPLPLPAIGSSLWADDATRGLALVQLKNCAACHVSGDPKLQSLLAANPAPLLGDIGRRAQPAWIQRWLRNPQSLKASAHMPRIDSGNDSAIDDLTHFLVSMGGPCDPLPDTPPDSDLVNTGMAAYHTIGCFACHGPLESISALPGGRPPSRLRPWRNYEDLGRPSLKSSPGILAEYLRDPLHVHPGGRMPSLSLDELEARAIAAYLIARDRSDGTPPSAGTFHLDTNRVDRGRDLFATMGCAACHELGPDRPAIKSTVQARSLEALAGVSLESAGCAARVADPRWPHFPLSDAQRRMMAAFFASLAERQSTTVPLELLAVTMSRLNCAGCHDFHGERGPEAAIAEYFTAIEEADLGDEGRLPPNLSDVGAKLNPQWIHEVLTANGAARPYLGARMPQFGDANVSALPSLFSAAAGTVPTPDHGPASTEDAATIGRELVGSAAMNCIQCHSVAGRPSTGTPGPDLAHMAERLRYDAFRRWISDPALTRPGTRMPSFFVNGYSAFTHLARGEAGPQIDAVWAYLSQGEFMPLPEGLVDPASLSLVVADEPIILRSFIDGAGTRAIGVGYPEQVHIAYDAGNCMLAMAWEGEFLNAVGAWANRGGTETNPTHVSWRADRQPLFAGVSLSGGSMNTPTPQFKGYRLDEQRRPVFMYELHAGNELILVEEQPVPRHEGGKPHLTLRFALSGPRGARVTVAPHGRASSGLARDDEGVFSIMLDDQGTAAFELEITW